MSYRFKGADFPVDYITMYFADIEFPSKESVTTLAFVFSMFKMQTPKSSSWLPCNRDTDYRTKHKMSTRLDISGFTIYCNFQTWLDLINHMDELIMTAWWPMCNFQIDIKWGPDLQNACENSSSKETFSISLLLSYSVARYTAACVLRACLSISLCLIWPHVFWTKISRV